VSRALLAATIAVGAVLALLGTEPLWSVAIAALLTFPVAAALALRGTDGAAAPLLPALLAGLAGGVLIALALRLAFAAPDWLSETNADCGAASTGTQQVVLWGAAVVLAASSLPIGVILVRVRAGLGRGDRGPAAGAGSPLSAYPVAVAAAGVALIACLFVTTC
jgi:hypothetical protein